MMVVAVDPEDQIVPMAFALTEGENSELWSWFMRLLRVQVLGPSCTICLISDCHPVLGPSRTICLILDHHAGLLNAAAEHIDGFPSLVHETLCR